MGASKEERDTAMVRDKDRASEMLASFWEHLSDVTSKADRKRLLAGAIAVLSEELLTESV